MECVPIAKIAVSAAPYAIDKPYDYLIPAPLLEKARVGTRVTAPFGRGNRMSEGVILACTTGVKTPGLKPITEVLDESPVLDDKEIAMALKYIDDNINATQFKRCFCYKMDDVLLVGDRKSIRHNFSPVNR